jgi:hypothetical protein
MKLKIIFFIETQSRLEVGEWIFPDYNSKSDVKTPGVYRNMKNTPLDFIEMKLV